MGDGGFPGGQYHQNGHSFCDHEPVGLRVSKAATKEPESPLPLSEDRAGEARRLVPFCNLVFARKQLLGMSCAGLRHKCLTRISTHARSNLACALESSKALRVNGSLTQMSSRHPSRTLRSF